MLTTAAGQARAAIITLAADRDGYTGYNLAGGDVPGSGTATALFVGRTNTNFGTGLHFDVSAIIPGSTINSATLQLYQTAGNTSLGITLRPMTSGSWTEAQLSAQDWNQLCSFGSTDLGTTGPTALNTYNSVGNAALAAEVSDWINTPSSNIGLLLNQTSYPNSTNKTFRARLADGGNAAQQPLLTIDYTPAPEPDAVALLAIAALALPARRRRQ